jgi:allantoin racemase
MSDHIIVINPNSTEDCTRGIDAAMEPLRMTGGPGIECVTMQDGPPGVESQGDSDAVAIPIRDYVQARDNDAGAFVIACFSDPGLHAAREATRKPVLGIAECAYMKAMTMGERFGVISILESSVKRHQRYVRQLGLDSRWAGDIAIGLGIVELSEEDKVLRHMIGAGERLRDDCGADVVVMGCAGMARYRDRLRDALGVQVVEPSQAAVTQAIGHIRCDR